MTWSPDYLAIYRNRMTEIALAKNSDNAAMLREHYRHNPIDFVNNWCITYDPRNAENQFMPFVLFPRQIEFIQFLQGCLNDNQSGLVEKSRDVGASWLCCAFAVWLLLFRGGSAVGFGSRVVDDVDKLGDPDSLFEKIRLTIGDLPAFLMPPKQIQTGYMKIVNPHNGSTITGGSGDNIGRGGRSTIFFKDESAHYEHPEMIEAALSANTDVQIDISSVNGNGNIFYNRRMAGEIWKQGERIPNGRTRVFIFDWRDNPLKNQEWYEEKKKKYEDDGLQHIFAQEVDRDYAASVEGVIIPAKWVRAAIDAHLKLKFTYGGERVAALDVADEGGDKNAYVARHGVILTRAQAWGEGDTGRTANRAVDLCAEDKIEQLYYDAIGVGAGVKAETNRLAAAQKLPKYLKIYPWVASAGVIEPNGYVIPHDNQSPRNEDFFSNIRAQAWWRVRTRFEKTYKAVTEGMRYNWEELISIPSGLENRAQLEQELSQVVYKKNPVGKIVIDKKPPGTKSPNLADGAIMCYNPNRKLTGFDVL